MLRQLKIKTLLACAKCENKEVQHYLTPEILNCFKFTPILKNTKLAHGQLSFTPPRDQNLCVEILPVLKESSHIDIPSDQLIQAVLHDICNKKDSYGRCELDEIPAMDNKGATNGRIENVVVEFSSPNIAKPFHAGHLRSTVIGRFVSNISRWFHQRVTSINFLGDWGTQFGYIAEGFKRFGCKENLNEEPLHHLLNVYVRMHQQSQTDPSIHQDAMNFFKRLEEGDAEARKFWRMCRDVSFSEYQSMYKKLDVNFDVTHCESMYSKECGSIIEELKSKNFLLFRDGVGYVDVSMAGDHRQQNMHAPLIKSDGSSLYLTRDLASALHRRKEFQAHKLYYVVENGQQQHFKLLNRCLEKCFDVRLNEDMHVKFGRVEGMSTRKGSAVFLSDLIRHARSTVKERMLARSTTKVTVEEDVDAVADALAVCGVVVFDLKQSRMNNYKFDWDEALNFNGDTGIFLQYTHARLNSLLERAAEYCKDASSYDASLLSEDVVLKMCQHLATFDDVLTKSYVQFEACHLVHYLFNLGRLVNLAHTQLKVLGQTEDVAQARIVLFRCTKQVLVNGMKILGLQPLNKI